MKKLSDRNAEYFRQSLVFRYHYSGDLALKRNFNKQEKKSIMQICLTVYNGLGYVIPIYKQIWITKRTIKTEEVKKKRIILEYTSTFLSTPLKCDRSKRVKLRLAKHIAARTREYARINNQFFHERGELLGGQNVSLTAHIKMTQERLALRAFEPTASP